MQIQPKKRRALCLYDIFAANQSQPNKHQRNKLKRTSIGLHFPHTLTLYYRFPPWALTVGATAIICIIIVGLIGNALTILALLKCQRVRNIAAAFIIRYSSILFNLRN